ncbi:hypothetical protein EYF80_061419 [Liparis tanakae]|uniref:Uncharacterized protein n=1 Tax=Liparis tanakae TaxID=230148 RepID=A0A4Z2EJB7_9TELE|nr:hypothetical protein EYF80_061419 [Liparis tanakae]
METSGNSYVTGFTTRSENPLAASDWLRGCAALQVCSAFTWEEGGARGGLEGGAEVQRSVSAEHQRHVRLSRETDPSMRREEEEEEGGRWRKM